VETPVVICGLLGAFVFGLLSGRFGWFALSAFVSVAGGIPVSLALFMPAWRVHKSGARLMIMTWLHALGFAGVMLLSVAWPVGVALRQASAQFDELIFAIALLAALLSAFVMLAWMWERVNVQLGLVRLILAWLLLSIIYALHYPLVQPFPSGETRGELAECSIWELVRLKLGDDGVCA
jgi:hypothetical protein